MRNLLICFLLFFISANSLSAQQSIGFSNPDSLQPLLDYRLPDWGYSNFYVYFDAIGNGFDQKSFSDKQVRKSGTMRLAPVYNLYRESEERTFRFNTSANFLYNGQIDKSESTTFDEKTEDTDFFTVLNMSFNLKGYVSEQSFIYGAIPLRSIIKEEKMKTVKIAH